MNKALYAGSFDPFTIGHLDIVKRALNIFESLDIVISINESKKSFFSSELKIKILNEVKKYLENLYDKKVNISYFEGMIFEYARENQIQTLVRGLRNFDDFGKEVTMYQYNKILSKDFIDTIFFSSPKELQIISSSAVKTLLFFGHDISDYVPFFVKDLILNYYNDIKNEKK